MILQFVKLKSNLPEEELLSKAKERKPEFDVIPGLYMYGTARNL